MSVVIWTGQDLDTLESTPALAVNYLAASTGTPGLALEGRPEIQVRSTQ